MKNNSMRLRITTLSVLLAFCAMMMMPAPAAAQNQPAPATAFVQGTTANGGVFNGILQVTNFVTQGTQLVAQGILNGTLTSKQGTVTQITNQAVTLPVSSVSATCQVLNLVLGPLDLNLLGLNVHLNQVVLNITANPSQGILGQLLCDLAGLLSGSTITGLLGQITTLLNQILAAL